MEKRTVIVKLIGLALIFALLYGVYRETGIWTCIALGLLFLVFYLHSWLGVRILGKIEEIEEDIYEDEDYDDFYEDEDEDDDGQPSFFR